MLWLIGGLFLLSGGCFALYKKIKPVSRPITPERTISYVNEHDPHDDPLRHEFIYHNEQRFRDSF